MAVDNVDSRHGECVCHIRERRSVWSVFVSEDDADVAGAGSTEITSFAEKLEESAPIGIVARLAACCQFFEGFVQERRFGAR
jgi:hypothetical protein